MHVQLNAQLSPCSNDLRAGMCRCVRSGYPRGYLLAIPSQFLSFFDQASRPLMLIFFTSEFVAPFPTGVHTMSVSLIDPHLTASKCPVSIYYVLWLLSTSRLASHALRKRIFHRFVWVLGSISVSSVSRLWLHFIQSTEASSCH